MGYKLDSAEYLKLICEVYDTANVMEIPDSIFAGESEAVGTDSMLQLMELTRNLQEVSNGYKTYITCNIVPMMHTVNDRVEEAKRVISESVEYSDDILHALPRVVNEAITISENAGKNTPTIISGINMDPGTIRGIERITARLLLALKKDILTAGFDTADATADWIKAGFPEITMTDVANLFKRKSDLYLEFKELCCESSIDPLTGKRVYSEDNLAMRSILAALDFKSRPDGSYYVDVNAYSLDPGAQNLIGYMHFLAERDCSGYKQGTDAMADYLGVDKEVCWQQYGGYCNSYDKVFDMATDMRRDELVLYADVDEDGVEEPYTFWFWKGDYCNLGLGGEVGFYEGNGKADPFVKCAVDHELGMSLSLDYDGDGIYEDHTLPMHEEGETTWWETSFNPYAAENLKEGQEFDAGKMSIIYTIDLSGDENEALYEAWVKKVDKNPNLGYDYNHDTRIVTYEFKGDGIAIW